MELVRPQICQIIMKKIICLAVLMSAAPVFARDFLVVSNPPFTVPAGVQTSIEVRVFNKTYYTVTETAGVDDAQVELRRIPNPSLYDPVNPSTYTVISIMNTGTGNNGSVFFTVDNSSTTLTVNERLNVYVTKTGYAPS